MSDELAQDDDGFEIASIGGSEDDDDLERRGSSERERERVREYAARPTSSGSPTVVMKGERQGGSGGLGGGVMGGSTSVRRDSEEAIFSVGEGDGSEDGWSEDEEKKKLTRKRD